MKTSFHTHPTIRLTLAALAAGLLGHSAQAADFDWNQTDTPNDWSLDANWTPTAAVGGPSAAGTSVLINTNIGGTSTINLFTTGNPGTATKTIGQMDIGDTNNTHGFTIATGTGAGILNFDGNGSNAQLNQLSTSGNNIISAPITLTSSLDMSNSAGANTLTLSTGGITSATAGLKTITSTTGSVTISGIIGNGSGTVAVVQDGAGTLTLSGNNSFTGGLTIKSGTVISQTSANAMGGGTVLLGDTSGSAAATLTIGTTTQDSILTNAITVQAGSSGTKTISAANIAQISLGGAITLNGDLLLDLNAPGGGSGVSVTASIPYLTVSGAIGGTGNLTLNVSGLGLTSNSGGQPVASAYTISGAITTTGTLTDASTGTLWHTISGNISNIASLEMNGANSTLFLSGSDNTYSGPTNVNAGVLRIANSGALQNTAVTVASGGTLQLANVTVGSGQTLTLTGQGTSFTAGALDTTNNGTYAGSIILAADATVADSLATTTLTISGGITGAGKTLTVGGVGNTTISGAIATTTGGLTKTGTGLLTLSGGSNSYTGTTRISAGILSLTNASALGGGGDITFDGGILRHNATNEVDYGSRIVNSTGPISIDTNSRNVTYADIATSNSGGLTKLGAGSLTLSGTNTYTGITAINAGVLGYTAPGGISAGGVFADAGGTLNSGGAYANVQAWLDSGAISTASTGAIALTGNSSENINFSTGGYTNLMLGVTADATYTGTITPAGSLYRLGGGGSALTLSGTNALTGVNGLVVGARSGLGVSTGSVIISGANDLSGATSVNVGTLTLSGNGTLGTSNVTVNPTATLAITSSTAGSAITRASSLALSNSTLTVTGNATADSTDTFTNALTIASGGNSTVTITPNASQNALLTLGSYVHNTGGTVLFRGTGLGANSLASITNGSANISITTPNLVGGAGANTTDRGIFVGAIGDITAGGTGFGANGGLLTYDATNGLRLLASGEYKTTITDTQTQLDNVRLTSTGGTTVTTTVDSATTINSLSLVVSTAASSAVVVSGTGTLTLNSGVIYANSIAPASTTASAMIVNNALDLNGREGIVFASTAGISEGVSGAELRLLGVIGNSGGNGLTIHGTTNSGVVTLGGTASNTYTGTTTINGANVILNKTAGLNAIAGDLVVNRNGVVFLALANQIADTANVTVNGGTFYTVTKNSGSGVAETINNLTVNNAGIAYAGSTLTVNGDATVTSGGLLRTWAVGNKIIIGGALNLSDGGTLRLLRSQSPTGGGVFDTVVTLNGGLNITNQTSGAYTPITIDFGTSNVQKGGQLVLNGDVTFTGNSTNTNTTMIDGPRGSGTQGVVALTGATPGDRTFTIGNGAAAVDMTITAPLVDGTGGASGLIKAGSGTLGLNGVSTYTGDTAVNAGTLLLADDAGLKFAIAGSGVNNKITGSGTAILNGDFTFDLTLAGTTLGNSWTIVDAGTLTATFGSTFTAATTLGAFSDLGSGLWSRSENSTTYQFSELTGELSVVPEPATWALLAFSLTTVLVLRRRKGLIFLLSYFPTALFLSGTKCCRTG